MTRLDVVHDPDSPAQTDLARALSRHAPAGWTVSPETTSSGGDFVLCVDPRRMPQRSATQTLLYWSATWPDELDAYHAAARCADGAIFACERYWRMLGQLPGTVWAPPGFDAEIFRPAGDQRPHRVLWLLPQNAAWRRGGGWLRDPSALARELGVPAEIWPDGASPHERADVARRATVLVCADDLGARSEDLLEAAACGCAIVCTAGVRPPSWLHDGAQGHRIVGSLSEVPRVLQEVLRDRHPEPECAVADYTWERRAAAIFAAFRSAPPQRPGSDLRDQLTVFVTTVGARSYAACRYHLELQDCRFRVEVIENLAPMSAAFQRMLDRCSTPVYVQLDEDMLLFPQAVRTLYEHLVASAPDVPLVVAWLHDAHLDAPIQGVKAYRHELVRRYPYVDERACEIGQLKRMAADGLRHRVLATEHGKPLVLGLHGTHWTPATIYERFFTLERVRRRLPGNLNWLEPIPALLLERYLARGSALDLCALLGLVAGATVPAEGEGHEKDFRAYGELPGIEQARRYVEGLGR